MAQEFQAILKRIGPRFARLGSRRQAGQYLQGLLGQAQRKNGWQLAETLGQSNPYRLQQFLYRAKWDADEVRDDLRVYVDEHLADPEGVLVIDETGFLKKGRHSVGVQVQYCGTAGRTTNCQIGVFLTYATTKGQIFLDRALYLPESWTNDRSRCRQAGVPDEVNFATKPELARQMIERTLAAGVPAQWVTGDRVYGGHNRLRNWLEAYPLAYVMALSPKDTLLNLKRWPQRVSIWLESLPTKERTR